MTIGSPLEEALSGGSDGQLWGTVLTRHALLWPSHGRFASSWRYRWLNGRPLFWVPRGGRVSSRRGWRRPRTCSPGSESGMSVRSNRDSTADASISSILDSICRMAPHLWAWTLLSSCLPDFWQSKTRSCPDIFFADTRRPRWRFPPAWPSL